MGNLVSDINPTTDVYLSYNHLNLITERRTTAGGAVQATYTWAADGTKLKAQNHTSGFTTDYVGPYQYENGTLSFFFTAEGRCIKSGASYVYEYVIKDHLGNTRATFDVPSGTTARLVQSTHYYPFGLEINSLAYTLSPGAPNDYKYNGKELQADFGLPYYDYGARMYDPQLGRFPTVDRIVEKYFSYNPYQYALLNPIKNIDVGGDSVWVTTKATQETVGDVVYQKIAVTIHITGKVLDISDSPSESASDRAAQLNSGLNSLSAVETSIGGDGKLHTQITYAINAQFEAVNSINEVGPGDHLQVIVDEVGGLSDPNIPGGGGSAGGVATLGGLISYVESGNSNSAGPHEVGHNLGLNHTSEAGNLMSYQRGSSPKLTLEQLKQVVGSANSGELNRGTNTTRATSSDIRIWPYPSSSSSRPYDASINKGDLIPTPIKR